MLLIYTNKNKGVFISMLYLCIWLIIGIALLITYLISLNFEPLSVILSDIRIHVLTLELTIFQFLIPFLLFTIYKIIDGFVDGLLVTLSDISFVSFFLFNVLNSGNLVISIIFNVIQINLTITFLYIFALMLIGYLWILLGDIWVIQIKKQPITRMLKFIKHVSYRIIRKELPEEPEKVVIEDDKSYIKSEECDEEHDWVNREEKKIHFEKNETPLLENWTKARGEFKKNFYQFYILDVVGLMFYGAIYAFFIFIISQERNVYNETISALFFPMWAVIFVAFKSPAHYLRANVILGEMISIQMLLYSLGFITAEGVFIVSIIISVSKYFFLDLSSYFNAMSVTEMTDFLLTMTGLAMIILFAIMAVYYFYHKIYHPENIEILISSKYMYYRRKREFNDYSILYNIMMTILWPFNLEYYRLIAQQLKYKKLSLNESWGWDYGRMSFQNGVRKLKKTRESKFRHFFKIILLFFIGYLLIGNIVGYIFILLGLRFLVFTKHKLSSLEIRIDYYLDKSQGSLFILSKNNILKLHDVPLEVAALIPSVQSYD
jgi:hypothetical protein